MHKKDLLSPWHHWSQKEKAVIALIVIAILIVLNALSHARYEADRLTIAGVPVPVAQQEAQKNRITTEVAQSLNRASNPIPEGKIGVMFGNTVFVADLALTEAEQIRGLSGREDIQPGEGMLFVFERPGRYAFWMKDMLFPLDIIWLNEAGKVIYIKKNAPPSSDPDIYTPPSEALYVLEVPAGSADINHISVGSHMTIFE